MLFFFSKSSAGWVKIKFNIPHFHVSDACRVCTLKARAKFDININYAAHCQMASKHGNDENIKRGLPCCCHLFAVACQSRFEPACFQKYVEVLGR